MSSVFGKAHFDCCVENRLKGQREEVRGTSGRLWRSSGEEIMMAWTRVVAVGMKGWGKDISPILQVEPGVCANEVHMRQYSVVFSTTSCSLCPLLLLSLVAAPDHCLPRLLWAVQEPRET